jgi:hypothetical protein
MRPTRARALRTWGLRTWGVELAGPSWYPRTVRDYSPQTHRQRLAERSWSVKTAMGGAISTALKQLLTERHLYQYVDVDLAPASEQGKALNQEALRAEPGVSPMPTPKLPANPEELKRDPDSCANVTWAFAGSNISGAMRDVIMFEAKDRPPHNPISDQCSSVILQGHEQEQWYYMAYQCQQCRSIPVRFLVRRSGLRLRLAGRDPIGFVPPPPGLKGNTKFFSDATVAHHAGQTLAGIFLLRTYIEQYWRTLPAVQALLKEKEKVTGEARATGDEMGAVYQDSLPNDFKSRFPSLLDIYKQLSSAMHEAKAEAAVFEDCAGRIAEHFDARRVFRL